MINVVLVEDHPLVQAGLSWILAGIPGVELAAAVAGIEDLAALAPRPDVVLISLDLPLPWRGQRAVRYLIATGYRVVVVNGDDTGVKAAAEVFRIGAAGYLGKRAASPDYAAAIRAAVAGRAYVGACTAAPGNGHRSALDIPARLTGREGDVAGLVVDGCTNAEIAAILGIRERTVDGHVENIKRKIGETRRVRMALRLRDLGYQSSGARVREPGPRGLAG